MLYAPLPGSKKAKRRAQADALAQFGVKDISKVRPGKPKKKKAKEPS